MRAEPFLDVPQNLYIIISGLSLHATTKSAFTLVSWLAIVLSLP